MAAALPLFGQMAPKIQAEVVLWSLGADGRVPRFAPRRVILFFLPDAGLVLPPDFNLDTVVQRGFYPGHGGVDERTAWHGPSGATPGRPSSRPTVP